MVLGAICSAKSGDLRSQDKFRKVGVNDFKNLYISFIVQFYLFLFLLCLNRFAQPIMHTTNPNGLQQKVAKVLV